MEFYKESGLKVGMGGTFIHSLHAAADKSTFCMSDHWATLISVFISQASDR